MFCYRFWTATVRQHLQRRSLPRAHGGGQVVVIKQVFWKPEEEALVTRAHKRTHSHTLTHANRGDTQTQAETVHNTGGLRRLYSREQRELGGSKSCCWPPDTDSHWDRKSTAVSRSSTSSAAVASILAREKSLMGSPSTIFQVLFCEQRSRLKPVTEFCLRPTGLRFDY